MPSQPTVHQLSQPAKLDDVLAAQKEEFTDCTSCRIMGSVAFTGLGIYTFYSGTTQLKQREVEILRSGSRWGLKERRAGVFGLSALLVAMGVYRLVR